MWIPSVVWTHINVWHQLPCRQRQKCQDAKAQTYDWYAFIDQIHCRKKYTAFFPYQSMICTLSKFHQIRAANYPPTQSPVLPTDRGISNFRLFDL